MEGALAIEAGQARAQTVDLAEAGLVRRVQAGDREAFGALIRGHQGPVARVGLAMLGDEAAAADLAQEVFLTFWRERARYRDQGRLRAYLLQIARNRALAELKRRRARGRIADEARGRPAPPAPTPDADVARGQDAARLKAALERLPDERREAVRLRFLHDLSVAEVAEITEVPVGTVKSRIGRGLAALREALGHGE